HPVDAAIGPHDAVLEVIVTFLLDGSRDRLDDALPVIGMNAVEEGLAHPGEGACGVTEQQLRGLRPFDLARVEVGVPGADLRGLVGESERLKARFDCALLQSRRGRWCASQWHACAGFGSVRFACCRLRGGRAIAALAERKTDTECGAFADLTRHCNLAVV